MGCTGTGGHGGCSRQRLRGLSCTRPCSGTLGTHCLSGHPLGFQRKNNIFICQRAHTHLFTSQGPGRGAGSHDPSSSGHCRKSSLCRVKETEGQGSPVVPSLPQCLRKIGCSAGTLRHSLIHSFHRYFRAKHLKVLGSKRGDTAPPSKEPRISRDDPE